MSSKSELKLPWPEMTLHFPAPVQTISESKLGDLWPEFVQAFQGKYSRFASYLMYLSTDFSGGFKVCSVLGANPAENTFNVPFTPPGPPISKEIRNQIWALCQKREWEEVNREEWELLGMSFLLTGELDSFYAWVEMTKKEFGLSEECKKFLTLLGWNFETNLAETNVLNSLVSYVIGDFAKADFSFLAQAVLKEGYWQFSGVLFDAIAKNIWNGREILPFLDFLSGFYADWQNWEKAKFLKVTLGKVPPFSALIRAKKILTPSEFIEYSNHLKLLFRGDFEEPEGDFGYDLAISVDPFFSTLIRFDKEGESYKAELMEELESKPYSYIVNLQYAIVLYRQGDANGFLQYYQNGGRLRYLAVPLYLYARVMENKNEEALANSIFQTLDKLHKTPVFPSELGEI